MLKIIRMTRGDVEFEYNGKRATLEGEFGFPDDCPYVFHMFGQRPTHWDEPQGERLSDSDFESLLEELGREFGKTGGRVERH